MNLLKELGGDYFYNRFQGTMLLTPEEVAGFVDFNGGRATLEEHVPLCLVEGPATKPVTKRGQLPYDFFKSLSVFSVPSMGWRCTAQGRFMSFITRNNRSYVRGVAISNIEKWHSPMTRFLFNEDALSEDYYNRDSTLVSLILKPEYTPIKEGIQAIREGEVLAFCSSNNLAFMPATAGKLAIFFNKNQVGEVAKDGTINCTISIIHQLIQEQLA